MPSCEVADALIDAYLRTFESIQRIIHIPTFKVEYERYRQDLSNVNKPFIMLMQLYMAIRATFHDKRFTLRNLTIQ
ncbi:hypothetical protein K4K61_003384 [Colletotrichum sp. SAR11_59]|nr:hypothetical protein K4K61_003384 [Colletotrichum sp. SAR11_59]